MAHQLGGVGFAAIGGLAALFVIVCQPLALAQLDQQLVAVQLQALPVIHISEHLSAHGLTICNVWQVPASHHQQGAMVPVLDSVQRRLGGAACEMNTCCYCLRTTPEVIRLQCPHEHDYPMTARF